MTTENAANAPEEIMQEILDEAMMPELSEDEFTINGHRVKIMPLKVKFQKQFAKAFTPVVQSFAMDLASNQYHGVRQEDGRMEYYTKTLKDFSFTDWLTAASGLLEQVDVLPKLIQILCHNGGYAITDEELDESTIQPEEMQAIVLRFCAKRGEIEQKIADFFTRVWPIVRRQALEGLDAANETVNRLISTSIASSKESATNTDGPLPTSPTS